MWNGHKFERLMLGNSEIAMGQRFLYEYKRKLLYVIGTFPDV